jgi:hypothetical protein
VAAKDKFIGGDIANGRHELVRISGDGVTSKCGAMRIRWYANRYPAFAVPFRVAWMGRRGCLLGLCHLGRRGGRLDTGSDVQQRAAAGAMVDGVFFEGLRPGAWARWARRTGTFALQWARRFMRSPLMRVSTTPMATFLFFDFPTAISTRPPIC